MTGSGCDGRGIFAKLFIVPQFIRRSNTLQHFVMIKGERYVRASKSNSSIYYKCRKFRRECKARAVQKMNSNVLYVTNGEHNHPLEPPQYEYLSSPKAYFDYNKPISFGVGQRGCVQLLLDGYAYVKNNSTDTQIIWKCSKKGSLRCRAKACTDIVDGIQCLTDIKGVHNHPIDVPRKVRARKKTSSDEVDNVLITENVKIE